MGENINTTAGPSGDSSNTNQEGPDTPPETQPMDVTTGPNPDGDGGGVEPSFSETANTTEATDVVSNPPQNAGAIVIISEQGVDNAEEGSVQPAPAQEAAPAQPAPEAQPAPAQPAPASQPYVPLTHATFHH